MLLVEGLTEKLVYSTLLEKLYKARKVNDDSLPKDLKMAVVEPLKSKAEKQFTCYALGGGFIVLVNCEGYDNINFMLKLLLARREFLDVVKELDLKLVIAADRDRRPMESIRNALRSWGLPVSGEGLLNVGLPNGVQLVVHVVEQGSEAEGATGEVEDELAELAEVLEPRLQNAIKRVEEACGELSSKQKLLLFLALARPRPKVRELNKELEEILRAADENLLKQGLRKIMESLSAALS